MTTPTTQEIIQDAQLGVAVASVFATGNPNAMLALQQANILITAATTALSTGTDITDAQLQVIRAGYDAAVADDQAAQAEAVKTP